MTVITIPDINNFIYVPLQQSIPVDIEIKVNNQTTSQNAPYLTPPNKPLLLSLGKLGILALPATNISYICVWPYIY
jgi:hypothetical protein